MLRIERLLPESQSMSPAVKGDATLTLPFELRKKSRLLVRLDDGEEAGLFLPRGTVLRHGDLLGATDGRSVRVLASFEDIYAVGATPECSLARAAYHLGNRHIPVEIRSDALAIERDPVLREMLEQIGASVREARAPFHPEPGAYGGGHRHGHDDGHSEEHALAQSVFTLRHGTPSLS